LNEVLRLPRLVGTREAVHDLLAEQGTAASLKGASLIVVATELAAGSTSFADELVQEVLTRRGANQLVLVGGPASFLSRVRESAAARELSGSVVVETAAKAGVRGGP